jgi:hypothetical protein
MRMIFYMFTRFRVRVLIPYVCTYVCMYVCMYTLILILHLSCAYAQTDTHTQTDRQTQRHRDTRTQTQGHSHSHTTNATYRKTSKMARFVLKCNEEDYLPLSATYRYTQQMLHTGTGAFDSFEPAPATHACTKAVNFALVATVGLLLPSSTY